MSERRLFSRKDLLFFLLFLALFLFVFKDFLFTGGIFFERDSTLLEIPMRQLCVQLLKEGNFALWTDAYGNGQPFLANPKNAVLYPGTWLYLILPFYAAFKFHYVLHFILGWLGIFYLGKSFKFSEQASFLGASVFMFSGVFLSSVEFYNHIAALCWMPWILLVLLRFQPGKFLLRLAVLAVLWSLLILTGTPYVIIVAGCFAFVLTMLVPAQRTKRFVMLALSIGLALCLSAAQLFPTLDLYGSSGREEGTSSLWSLEPLQLVNFAFPNFMGNDRQPGHEDYWGSHLFERGAPLYYSLFLGFGALMLAFFGLKRPYDYRNTLFVVLACFFFVLALGKRMPFYPLWKDLPPFSGIRYPVKYMVPFTFCLALLAALGFDRLFRDKRRREKMPLLLPALSAALLVLFFALRSPLIEILSRFFVIDKISSAADLSDSLFGGLFILFVCAFLVFLSRFLLSGKKTIAWIVLAVAVLHPVIINRFINPVMPVSLLTKPRLLQGKWEEGNSSARIYRDRYLPFAFKEGAGGTEGVYRYFRESLFPYYGVQFGVKYMFSKDFYNIYDKNMGALIDVFEASNPDNKVKLLKSVGCDFSLAHFALPDLPSEEIVLQGFRLYRQDITGRLPEACLIYDSRKVESFRERLEVFQDPGFDPEVTAIVEKDVPLSGLRKKGDHDTVRPVESFQSRQRYQVINTQPALFVLQGNFDPGWRAWVDGVETDILFVNLSARAVFLENGTHEVTFRYFPKSFRFGLAASSAALVLILTALIFCFFRRVVFRFGTKQMDF